MLLSLFDIYFVCGDLIIWFSMLLDLLILNKKQLNWPGPASSEGELAFCKFSFQQDLRSNRVSASAQIFSSAIKYIHI